MAAAAAALARIRKLSNQRLARDLSAAAGAAAISVIAGVALYVLAGQFADELPWRNAAAASLLSFPAVAATVLNAAIRRNPRLNPGSTLGSFVFGAIAAAALAGWATFSWRGPRGNWAASEVLVAAASLTVLFAASACVGWWCGRRIGRSHE